MYRIWQWVTMGFCDFIYIFHVLTQKKAISDPSTKMILLVKTKLLSYLMKIRDIINIRKPSNMTTIQKITRAFSSIVLGFPWFQQGKGVEKSSQHQPRRWFAPRFAICQLRGNMYFHAYLIDGSFGTSVQKPKDYTSSMRSLWNIQIKIYNNN